MERKNPADIFFLGLREQGSKRTHRTQFNIEISGVRQKTCQQIAALAEREIICAAFTRIARSDNNWRLSAPANVAAATGQDRHLAFELIGDGIQVIESNLKKVRRLIGSEGQAQIARRDDHADYLGPDSFDRSARCHIIRDSGNQGRGMMLAPL